MAQRWHDLLFAHWPLAPERVRPRILRGLELDLFDGAAWLGVIPFRMSGVRVRFAPPLPGAAAFPELNVRTYVRLGDRPGVLFFSLDARSRLAVALARRWFALPYFRAEMRCEERTGEIAYHSRRTHPGAPPAELDARYAPVDGPEGEPRATTPGSLAHFLTARYALFNEDRKGALLTTEIDHAPWPLQPARATFARNTLAEAAGFELPAAPPLLHFSRFLDVRIWSPRRASPGQS
jgi:uncharacterized protein YqjF (DUF2071 family)